MPLRARWYAGIRHAYAARHVDGLLLASAANFLTCTAPTSPWGIRWPPPRAPGRCMQTLKLDFQMATRQCASQIGALPAQAKVRLRVGVLKFCILMVGVLNSLQGSSSNSIERSRAAARFPWTTGSTSCTPLASILCPPPPVMSPSDITAHIVAMPMSTSSREKPRLRDARTGCCF